MKPIERIYCRTAQILLCPVRPLLLGKDGSSFSIRFWGLEILTTATEAYLSRATSLAQRRDAYEAVSLIMEYLDEAERGQGDAKKQIRRAAILAKRAYDPGHVGYIRALADCLREQYGLPFWLCSAVLLPHVLEACGERIHKRLHKLGVASGVSLASERHDKGAEAFVSAIKGLNGRLGIPKKLAVLRREDIPDLARCAACEANPLYPVPVLMDAKELEEVYIRLLE